MPPGTSPNVALLGEIYDRFWRGDWAEAVALLDADIEWIMPPDGIPPDRVNRGREAVLEIFRDFFEDLESFTGGAELMDLEDDRVLADGHMKGRGKSSGAEVEMSFTQLWEFRDGRPVRQEFFLAREDALKAAGFRK
jgi:ketosteroid isomerase-like protein